MVDIASRARRRSADNSAAICDSETTAETFDTATAFRRYAPYIAAVGLRLLGRSDEVDDLVQDVFMKAHTSRATLRNQEHLKSWLATIATRLAIQRLRRRKLRSFIHLESRPDYEDIADSSATAEQKTLLAEVYRALDRIPVNERIVWTLHYIEGEPIERVAALCRCSSSTALRRLKRAILKVKAEVGHG